MVDPGDDSDDNESNRPAKPLDRVKPEKLKSAGIPLFGVRFSDLSYWRWLEFLIHFSFSPWISLLPVGRKSHWRKIDTWIFGQKHNQTCPPPKAWCYMF
jgi:hypothetical protein